MTPDFIQLAKENQRRIVLPESNDIRILEAAEAVIRKGIAQLILLGKPEQLEPQLEALNLDPRRLTIIDPDKNEYSERFAQTIYQLRQSKGISPKEALELSKQPLYFANLLVREGIADACVAGANHATGDVIRAALQVIGTASKGSRLSSFFIMLSDTLPAPALFADCAINIDPNANQLANIAYQSAINAKALLGLDPKVALLSFSTKGSAHHAEVDKVRKATTMLNEQHPEIKAIGEIQFDAAFSQETLDKKWPDADFATPANVFVFPSLEAGNIGYKIAERIGGAKAIGPILQGLAKPVNDLSRGSSVESIIDTIAVTALQVN